jgi:hypothetical protein
MWANYSVFMPTTTHRAATVVIRTTVATPKTTVLLVVAIVDAWGVETVKGVPTFAVWWVATVVIVATSVVLGIRAVVVVATVVDLGLGKSMNTFRHNQKRILDNKQKKPRMREIFNSRKGRPINMNLKRMSDRNNSHIASCQCIYYYILGYRPFFFDYHWCN